MPVYVDTLFGSFPPIASRFRLARDSECSSVWVFHHTAIELGIAIHYDVAVRAGFEKGFTQLLG